jgi:hypothetical protein
MCITQKLEIGRAGTIFSLDSLKRQHLVFLPRLGRLIDTAAAAAAAAAVVVSGTGTRRSHPSYVNETNKTTETTT